jgi:hypothetical protein
LITFKGGNNMEVQEVLKKTAILSLTISLWSGKRVLEAEDVGLRENEIPSVVNLGSKKVLDPQKLAPFLALKRQAERLCGSYGVRFLNGYAIPLEKLGSLEPELKLMEGMFENTLNTFLQEYKTNLAAWETEHPNLAESIRRAAPDEAYLRSRLSFSYQVFSVIPTVGFENNLEEQVSGLTGQLRKEIRDTARQIWENSLRPENGKMVSRKVLRPIRGLIEKMDGLSYIDSSVAQDADYHKQILNNLPAKGTLSGQALLQLRSSVLLLSELALTEAEAGTMAADDEEAETGSEVKAESEDETKPEGEAEVEVEVERKPVQPSPEVWF